MLAEKNKPSVEQKSVLFGAIPAEGYICAVTSPLLVESPMMKVVIVASLLHLASSMWRRPGRVPDERDQFQINQPDDTAGWFFEPETCKRCGREMARSVAAGCPWECPSCDSGVVLPVVLLPSANAGGETLEGAISDGGPEHEVPDVPGERWALVPWGPQPFHSDEVPDMPGERWPLVPWEPQLRVEQQRPWEVLARDTYKSNQKAQALEWLAQQGVLPPFIKETSWAGSTAWICYCHDCNDCTKAWRFTLREESGVRWMVVEIDGACTGIINAKRRKLHSATQPSSCIGALLAFLENPPSNVVMLDHIVTATICRIVFTTVLGRDFAEACQLPGILVDFTFNTNIEGILLGCGGYVGLKAAKLPPHMRLVPVVFVLADAEDDGAHTIMFHWLRHLRGEGTPPPAYGFFDCTVLNTAMSFFGPDFLCSRCLQHVRKNVR